MTIQAEKPKNKFIAFNNSFHGRTYGSIATTRQPKYHAGFEPLLPGIDFADFNDLVRYLAYECTIMGYKTNGSTVVN